MKRKRWGIKIAAGVLAVIMGCAAVLAALGVGLFRSLEDTGLPRIDVVTENGAKILSKEEYVNCTVSLSGTDAEFCFTDAAAGIRGRGNDTWRYYPKKPYRIKFEEKTALFGEPKNKSWVLLAMYNDFSLIKDRLAFTMADSLGGDGFVPAYYYAELYLNGAYQGIYLLTDQVDENKGRTDVKADFAPEDTAVPFLVELDARAPEEGVEGVDWFSVSGHPYAIKYPEADERYTDAQFAYIKSYIETVDTLCRKPDVTFEELSEYIDVDSLIDYYLVQEVMGQPEINWKSVYMSKTADGKLKMGPVWDFDWSAMGPSTGDSKNNYRGKYDGFRSADNWFAALYEGSPAFRTALTARWSEARANILSAIDTVEQEKDVIARAAKRDRMRWHWYRVGGGFEACSDEVIDWCRNRILWLDEEFLAK